MSAEPGISENVSKKPRGRPRVLSVETEAINLALNVYERKHSRRARVNHNYTMRALMLLDAQKDKEEFAWLGMMSEHSEPPWRTTILAELGRIDDNSAFISIARQLCRLKPKTRDAVMMVRRWRVGDKAKPGSADTLTDEMSRLVDNYRRRHPDITFSEMKAAINTTYRAVEYLEQEEGR